MTDEDKLRNELTKLSKMITKYGWDSTEPELCAQHALVHQLRQKIEQRRCPSR